MADAQLPHGLCALLRAAGHDAIHTLDLPAGNRSSDSHITGVARHEKRVVVTKDADFVESFLLRGEPERLLFITTGNLGNPELFRLLEANLETLCELLHTNSIVEVSLHEIVVRH